MSPVQQFVVLAAGFGSRLGAPQPKALTPLVDGSTVLDRQLGLIRAAVPGARVHVVVGHKAMAVLEAHPDVLFAYNEAYDTTNTAKSLARALELCPPGPVVWLNGDVVFEAEVLTRVLAVASGGESAVAVAYGPVGAEEVAFTVDADGWIASLAKATPGGLGEAVGVNAVCAQDRPGLERRLREVDDQDYFERAVELAVARDSARYRPVDVTDLGVVEVDFPEDLVRADEVVIASAEATPPAR